jgi:23S rRNA (guanosine2251-2'-O)-methyltransferase
VERRGLRRDRTLDFDDLVYGIHAVGEALMAEEALRSIHVASDRKKDGALRELLARAEDAGVAVRFEHREFFAKLPFKAHQGIVAIVPPFSYVTLGDVLARSPRGRYRLCVVLDHLTDPHNVGAIVRTAESAGADAVILPDRRSAGVNATVRKAAAGAAAHLPIARVGNLAEAIRTLKKARVWIAGADAGAASTIWTEVDFNRDLALVIGAEGGGLGALIKRECDYLVRVPMRGRIESLNASVAAGVLLYEIVRQRS